MAFQVIVRKMDGYLSATFEGDLNFANFQKAYEVVLKSPDFTKGINLLWDIRKVDPSNLKFEDISAIAKHVTGNAKERGAGYRSAILITTDFGYGLSRQYLALMEKPMGQLSIFKSLEEAESWLTES